MLILARVSSYKYSFDTCAIFLVFKSIIFDHTTLIPMMGIGSVNFFNIHFSVAYLLLSPLYFVGPSLLIFIWKLISYGGFIIIVSYLIKNDKQSSASNWERNLFLVLVCLHPTFITNLISPDIWDSDLILPFLALSILYTSFNRYYLGIFWIFLTFFIKEDMMLLGIMYGLFIAIKSKEVKYLIFSLFSLAMFLIVTNILMPLSSTSESGLELLNFSYGNLGESMGEIIINSVLHPTLLFENGFWIRKFASIFIIFACFGFLPFLKKRSIIYLIPGIAVIGYTIIAAQPYLDYSKHYMLAFFPFVVWSAYETFITIHEDSRSRVAFLAIILSISIVIIFQLNMRSWSYYFTPIKNIDTLESISANLIPKDASVLTGGIASPWVCYNRNCFVSADFQPKEIELIKYKYILINLSTVFWEVQSCNDYTLLSNLKALNQNSNYEVKYNNNDIILLMRTTPGISSFQPKWSENLENYQYVSQGCVKNNIMNIFKKL
ncbi:Uncharacterized membrane protein [Polynucleobacter meluiroseus]|uniref:Uncharacterized membrane protein n=2 Tax=Polynucleobacter meluiroseus TaxID=1938814 RepID=A0A240E2D6_9BURK|nr:Uncharacterized membrane protein [Polynucleobacter meluiroseus]